MYIHLARVCATWLESVANTRTKKAYTVTAYICWIGKRKQSYAETQKRKHKFAHTISMVWVSVDSSINQWLYPL